MKYKFYGGLFIFLSFVILIYCSFFKDIKANTMSKEDFFSNLKHYKINKIVIEPLATDIEPKFKSKIITDLETIQSIISEIYNCEMRKDGVLLLGNYEIIFFENEKEIVKGQIFIHKKYHDFVFFRYYYYDEQENMKRMFELYSRDSKLFQVICPLIDCLNRDGID